MNDLMRKKLEISKHILEALTTQNFKMVNENATLLRILSESDAWKSPSLRDAEIYPSLKYDFRRTVEEMIKQAKTNNIDSVTLAYVQMTMSCVTCHKFIRLPQAQELERRSVHFIH